MEAGSDSFLRLSVRWAKIPPVITIITTASPSWDETRRFVLAVATYQASRNCTIELIVVDDLRVLSGVAQVGQLAPDVLVKLFVPEVRGQLDSGIHALAHANGELIVTIDPDMHENLADIDRFVERQASGCSLVYGVRIARGDVSRLRVLISRLYNWVVRKVFLLPVHDINTPMLLLSADIVPEILAYDGRHGLVKVYFPYVLGTRFAEVKIEVSGMSKTSSYSYLRLAGFMLRQLAGLSVFLRFRLGLHRHAA